MLEQFNGWTLGFYRNRVLTLYFHFIVITFGLRKQAQPSSPVSGFWYVLGVAIGLWHLMPWIFKAVCPS